jgi:eukaryotic-like serine/threonine-protein kinase
MTESGAQLESLFQRALELRGAERDRFVERECGRWPELHARLLRLLAAHEQLSRGPRADFLREIDAVRAAALVEALAPEPEAGASIGRYRIERMLARGGMGVVYQATDPTLGRSVALKVLTASLGDDAAANQRLMREARAASSLDHPNIGTIYEVGESEDGRLFIAMAYYEGVTLRSHVRDGGVSIPDMVRVALPLADALAAAHDRGIVHRDVKPENVLITTDGVLKLLDFGIATAAAQVTTRVGVTAGTAAYMSPEQTRGEPATPQSDVWSLGVLLHELITGRRPFASDSSDALIYGIRNDDPPPIDSLRPDVPPRLAAVVARCLHKDPADRFASAAEVGRALREAASAATMGQAATARWRRPAFAAVVTLVVLAAVGAFAAQRGDGMIIDARGFAGGAFAERGWVVVADVDAVEDDAAVARAVREALTVDFQQSGFVNVYGRGQLAGVLQRMGLAPSSHLDVTVALEVAERAGAGAVIAVSVSRLGAEYLLAGRGIQPGTGDELFAVRATAGEDRLVAAVESLSREMRRRLGETRGTIARSRPLPEVTTTSLDALKLYAEAEHAERSQQIDRAAALLEAAIEADSTFAMAYRGAGVLAWNLLRMGDAAEYFAKAYAHRARLTDRERLHVEAIYHNTVTLDPRLAAATYEQLAARYPDDFRGAANLAVVVITWFGDYERAHQALARVQSVDRHSMVYLRSLLLTAVVTGREVHADSLLQVAEAEGFDDLVVRWRLARAFAAGRHREAAAFCDSVLSAQTTAAALLDDGELCGSMDVAAGRLRQGLARLHDAERRYLAANRYRNLTHVTHAIAAAHIMRGDVDQGVAVIEGMLARVPPTAVGEPERFINRTNLQLQAALLGRSDVVDRIGEWYPDFHDADHWFGVMGRSMVRAAGAIADGKGDVALALLREAVPPEGPPGGWRIWNEILHALAFETTAELDSAAVRYTRAAHPPFQSIDYLTKDRVYLPFALERLAHVERARGNAAGAAAAYDRLLALWRDADPEIAHRVAAVRAAAASVEGPR